MSSVGREKSHFELQNEGKRSVKAANKRLVVRLFEEVIDGGDLDLADDLLRPDYIQHNPHAGQGSEGFKKYFTDLDEPG